MKRFLKISVILIVLLVGALVVGPSFIDWNKYKPQIISQLSNISGHDYKIDGSLELSILPAPHLVVEKFSVASPSTAQTIASLDKVSVYVALMPLLSGKVEVSRVSLIKPVINVHVDAQGGQSWMTKELEDKFAKGEEKKDETASSSNALNSIALEEIVIEGGTIRYSDDTKKQSYEISGINVSLKGDTVYGPYTVSGDFQYQGNKVDFSTKSGRLDKMAESIPVQFDLGIEALQTSMSYKGVLEKAADSTSVDLQGEAHIAAKDLGKTISAFTAGDAGMSGVAIETKGIVTYDGSKVQYSNATLSVMEMPLNVSMLLEGIDGKGAMNFTGGISADKPVDLDKFMTQFASGAAKGKAAKTKTAKQGKGLLPETLTLPKDISAKFDINIASATYKGTTYNGIKMPFTLDRSAFKSELKASLPGDTNIDVEMFLKFASRTVSSNNGSVTLADPKLTLRGNVNSREPIVVVDAFVPKFSNDIARSVLRSPVSLELNNTVVTPSSVDIGSASIRVLDSAMNVSGRYDLSENGGKNTVKIAAQASDVDLDKWHNVLVPEKTAVATPQPVDVKKVVQSFALPINLDAEIMLTNSHFRAERYGRIFLKGTYINDKLDLSSLGFNDSKNNSVTLSGHVDSVSALKGVDLSLTAKSPDIRATMNGLNMDTASLPAGIKAVEVVANTKGSSEAVSFVANVSSEQAKVEAKGSLEDPLGKRAVKNVELRLRHPDYAKFARIFAPNFKGGSFKQQDLDVYSKIDRSGDLYSFDNVKARIGPSVIAGKLSVNTGGSVPQVEGNLNVDQLPLSQILGMAPKVKSAASSSGSAKGQTSVRWSRNAINSDFLHMLNMKLQTRINSFSYDKWLLTNVGFGVNLQGGALSVSEFTGQAYGGQIIGSANISSAGKKRQPLSVKSTGQLNNVSLENVVQAFSGSRLLKAQGDVSVSYDIQTTGLSPAALIVDLNGQAKTNGQNIIIQGFDLAKLSRTLAAPSSSFSENFGNMFSSTMQNGQTRFDTLDGIFTIKEGIVNFDKLELDGPDAVLNGTGNVSLPLWTIDMVNTIQLKEPENAPSLKIDFKGSLDNPKQTFGKKAMEQYFQSQIQGLLLNPLLDKLQDKKGTTTQQGTTQGTTGGTQGTTQQTPEEALFGVIDGFLGGKR